MRHTTIRHFACIALLFLLATLPLASRAAPPMRPGTVFSDCADCPSMVVIPAGSFTMGSPPSEAGHQNSESPQHQVTIARSFAMGRHEVTRGQYARFIRETAYEVKNGCWSLENGRNFEVPEHGWRDPGFPQTDDHPAICISWNEARAFADWLSRKTGKHYRLPTEAEWEYAARANTTSAHFWGNDPDQACQFANVMDITGKRSFSNVNWEHNCVDGAVQTAPVGSLRPNPFGLYDMLGNLWEWTEDTYHDSYEGAPADGSAWATPGEERVLRGGSWQNRASHVRSAARNSDEPTDHDNFTGFRLVRELP